MQQETVKQGLYKHYKGNFYKVIGEAKHSENMEQLVVYQALYGDYGLWVRPKVMFLEEIMVEGKIVPRFCYVDEQIP